jgi:hypothetical protein
MVRNLHLAELAQLAQQVRNRRAMLGSLSATALLAAVSQPSSTPARKKGIKRPPTKPKPRDRCKLQDGQCHAYFTNYCAPAVEPRACEQLLLPCCTVLGECDVTSFFACLVSAA